MPAYLPIPQELTKIINAKNEGNLAAKAETSGGRLKTVGSTTYVGRRQLTWRALCRSV